VLQSYISFAASTLQPWVWPAAVVAAVSFPLFLLLRRWACGPGFRLVKSTRAATAAGGHHEGRLDHVHVPRPGQERQQVRQSEGLHGHRRPEGRRSAADALGARRDNRPAYIPWPPPRTLAYLPADALLHFHTFTTAQRTPDGCPQRRRAHALWSRGRIGKPVRVRRCPATVMGRFTRP